MIVLSNAITRKVIWKPVGQSGVESAVSLIHIRETFTLTDYSEYIVDISRDRKLHECPSSLKIFTGNKKALFCLIQRAGKGFSGSQNISPSRKNTKRSLSHKLPLSQLYRNTEGT